MFDEKKHEFASKTNKQPERKPENAEISVVLFAAFQSSDDENKRGWTLSNQSEKIWAGLQVFLHGVRLSRPFTSTVQTTTTKTTCEMTERGSETHRNVSQQLMKFKSVFPASKLEMFPHWFMFISLNMVVDVLQVTLVVCCLWKFASCAVKTLLSCIQV